MKRSDLQLLQKINFPLNSKQNNLLVKWFTKPSAAFTYLQDSLHLVYRNTLYKRHRADIHLGGLINLIFPKVLTQHIPEWVAWGTLHFHTWNHSLRERGVWVAGKYMTLVMQDLIQVSENNLGKVCKKITELFHEFQVKIRWSLGRAFSHDSCDWLGTVAIP